MILLSKISNGYSVFNTRASNTFIEKLKTPTIHFSATTHAITQRLIPSNLKLQVYIYIPLFLDPTKAIVHTLIRHPMLIQSISTKLFFDPPTSIHTHTHTYTAISTERREIGSKPEGTRRTRDYARQLADRIADCARQLSFNPRESPPGAEGAPRTRKFRNNRCCIYVGWLHNRRIWNSFVRDRKRRGSGSLKFVIKCEV